MAHTKNKNKRKPNKQPRKIKTSILSSTDYPFINPIIVTSDNKIVDGQHRYEVCKDKNLKLRIIMMNFTSEQIQEDNFVLELRKLQEIQRDNLEKWFVENKIGYEEQLTLCSSIDRMQKFFEFENRFKSDDEYWIQLADCYSVSDNNFKYLNEIKRSFLSKRLNRDSLMSQKERDVLKNLPEIVTIYRGMIEDEEKSGSFGISWTLRKSVAENFAGGFIHNYDTKNKKHIVKELNVNKSSIIAYFEERNEEEVIYIHELNF